MSKLVTWVIDSEKPTALQAALEVWFHHFDHTHWATCFTVDDLSIDVEPFTESGGMAHMVETVMWHGLDRMGLIEREGRFIVQLHNAEGVHDVAGYDERGDAIDYIERVNDLLCLLTDGGEVGVE